jgi:DNA-binding protein Fis
MADIEQKQRHDKSLSLEQAVKEFEDFFFRSNRGKLYKFVLQAIEKPLIENVLGRTDGNQCKAAHVLGINRNTLHAKIKKLGIEVRKWKRL